jgi:putative ABC transport system ATP-binding protein
VVLVTHEHDVADFAGRLISFRDGRVRNDARQVPLDAEAALAVFDGQGTGAAA